MTPDEAIAEVERRAEAAYQTPQGPDYRAIVEDVAREGGMAFDDLRTAWMDAWMMGAN